MGRLPLIDPDDPEADPAVTAVLGAIREGAGRDWNVFRAVGNHPAIFSGLMQLLSAGYLSTSLTPRQRELAYLTASWVNECHY